MRTVLLLLLFALRARAAITFPVGNLQGWCEDGNHTVTTSGLASTTFVQQSFPACTVTVYLTGTSTTAPIYSNASGTTLSNPFTASTSGQWTFWAGSGTYDIKFSGTGIATPFTRSGYYVQPPSLVTQFGAACDGSTDDTTPFANAIASGIVSLMVPPGRTCVIGPVTLTNNMALYSDGTGTLLAKAAYTAATGMVNIGGSNITVSGLILDGNVANQTNRLNLILDNGGHSGVIVTGNHFKDTGGNGLQASTSEIANWLVNENLFDTISTMNSGGGAGITMPTACNGCTIAHNRFIGNSDMQAAIGVGGTNTSTRVIIDSNVVHSMVLVPIEFNSECEFCAVLGNTVDGAGTNGISSEAMTDGTITGNTVANQSNECIELENGVRVVISGNACYNSNGGIASFGGTSSGSSDITVTGNSFNTVTYTAGNGYCIIADSWVRANIGSNSFKDCMNEGIKMTFNAALGGAGGSDINIHDNAFQFSTTRSNAPIAVEVNTYNQATVRGNLVRVDQAGGSAGQNLGVITVSNTCNRLTITNNSIYSGIMSGANTAGIYLTNPTSVTDGYIINNFVDGFAKGYFDSTGTTMSNVIITPNQYLNVTAAYTFNSSDTYNLLGTATYGNLFYDCPAAQCAVNVPLYISPLTAQNGRVMQWTRDSSTTGAVTWQVGHGVAANNSNIVASITNASFEVNSGGVISSMTYPFLDCNGASGNLTGGYIISGHYIFYGTSSPAGVTSGSTGDLFLRTDGGASTTLYVKEGGSCTTANWTAK